MNATKETVQPCERVLAVDDNEDMLESLAEVLEMGGAVVRTATSVQGAIEVLADGFDPTVIVIDLRLGGERGDELVRRIRLDRRHARIPVLLMSGDAPELRQLDASGQATLGKPFDIDRLFEVLSELCAKTGASRVRYG